MMKDDIEFLRGQRDDLLERIHYYLDSHSKVPPSIMDEYYMICIEIDSMEGFDA